MVIQCENISEGPWLGKGDHLEICYSSISERDSLGENYGDDKKNIYQELKEH